MILTPQYVPMFHVKKHHGDPTIYCKSLPPHQTLVASFIIRPNFFVDGTFYLIFRQGSGLATPIAAMYFPISSHITALDRPDEGSSLPSRI